VRVGSARPPKTTLPDAVRVDLAICGGGPAGLATAIHAARAGLRAVVCDARPLPLDKACGEGVMPAGVAALDAMGVRVPAASRAAFLGIRYVEQGRVAEGRFRSGEGWGVRRTALVVGLAERARELGVELRYGCPLTRWRREPGGGIAADTSGGALRAPLLVGADGLHSRIRREAGLARAWRGARRLGLRLHFDVTPWSRCVEVHLAGDVEAYVTPVGPSEVGVALMWNGDERRQQELMAAFPALRERLLDAPQSSEPRGAGPFRQGVRRRFAPGVALVGDAAGYLDPLTGEGIALGLLTAGALVDTVAASRPLAEYERAYRRLSRNYYRLTRLLLAIAPRRGLRRRMIASLARHPDLFTHLLEVSDGRATLRGLGAGGAARLLGGLLADPPAPADHSGDGGPGISRSIVCSRSRSERSKSHSSRAWGNTAS